MRARRKFENQKLPRAPPKTFLNLFVDKCRRRPPPGEGAVRARARARAKYPEFFFLAISSSAFIIIVARPILKPEPAFFKNNQKTPGQRWSFNSRSNVGSGPTPKSRFLTFTFSYFEPIFPRPILNPNVEFFKNDQKTQRQSGSFNSRPHVGPGPTPKSMI